MSPLETCRIVTICIRFLHQPTAIEIFLSSAPCGRAGDWCDVSRRSSVFFHFPTESPSESQQHSTLPPVRTFCNALKSLCSRDQLSVCYITNARDAFAATGIHKKWLSGHVTNFDYIMALNTFSGRSFNDLRQYPVNLRANATDIPLQTHPCSGVSVGLVRLHQRRNRLEQHQKLQVEPTLYPALGYITEI